MWAGVEIKGRFVKMREVEYGCTIMESEPGGRERLSVRRTEGDYLKEEDPWELPVRRKYLLMEI